MVFSGMFFLMIVNYFTCSGFCQVEACEEGLTRPAFVLRGGCLTAVLVRLGIFAQLRLKHFEYLRKPRQGLYLPMWKGSF